LTAFIGDNGGIGEWIWKGRRNDEHVESTEISVLFKDLEYLLRFGRINQNLDIVYEHVNQEKLPNPIANHGSFNLANIGTSMLARLADYKENLDKISLEKVISLFGQVINIFSKITTYTDLQTNRQSEIRRPQTIDSLSDFLEEDGSNLGLVLKSLVQMKNIKNNLIKNLRKFYPRITDYEIIST